MPAAWGSSRGGTQGKSRHGLIVAAAGVLALVAATGTALAAAGDLDPGFGSGGKVTTGIEQAGDDQATAVAVQGDGKIVAAGITTGAGLGAPPGDFAVVRYNTDGTLDTTFSGDGIATTDFGGSLFAVANSVAIQADGKIVAAGFVGTMGVGGQASADFAVARYESDGDPDTTFSGDGRLFTGFGAGGAEGRDVAIQATGTNCPCPIVAGDSSAEGDDGDFALVRYTNGGVLDSSFGGDGRVIADDVFGAGTHDSARGIEIQATGTNCPCAVVAGTADETGNAGDPDLALARFESDGDLDGTFGSGGTVTTEFGTGTNEDIGFDVALQSNGEILAAGASNDDFAIARYESDGGLDDTTTPFSTDGKQTTDIGGGDQARRIAIQAGGEIVLAGSSTTFNPPLDTSDFAVARYESDGDPDNTFSTNGQLTTDIHGGSFDEGRGVAIQSGGEIVVAGLARPTTFGFQTPSDFVLTRYESDGDLDDTTTPFGGDGKIDTLISSAFADEANAVAVQADGRIVVAGSTIDEPGVDDHDIVVARYNPNGSPDSSFGGDGVVVTEFQGQEAPDAANGVAVQSNGAIVVAGYTEVDGSRDFALARYQPDGNPDGTFSGDAEQITDFGTGTAFDQAHDIAIQANGEIVAAGQTDASGSGEIAVARYEPGGDLDDNTTPFSTDGKQTTGIATAAEAHGVAIQPSTGAIVVGGSTDEGTHGSFTAVRYEPDGDPDSTFGGGDGIATIDFGDSFDDGRDVVLQADGAVLVAGTARDADAPAPECGGLAPGFDLALARFDSDGDPDNTFSNDGKLTADFGGTQDRGRAVAVQPDGAILVAGQVDADFLLARYTSGGSADGAFGGGDGVVTTDIGSGTCDGASDVAVTSAGILVAGTSDDRFALARFAQADPPTPPPPDGGEPADTAPPNTAILSGPKDKTKQKSAAFTFTGDDARALAGFQCKLDSGAFAPCTSPHTVRVKKGKHTFEVRAIDAAGNVDPTPATDDWKVKKKKRR